MTDPSRDQTAKVGTSAVKGFRANDYQARQGREFQGYQNS